MHRTEKWHILFVFPWYDVSCIASSKDLRCMDRRLLSWFHAIRNFFPNTVDCSNYSYFFWRSVFAKFRDVKKYQRWHSDLSQWKNQPASEQHAQNEKDWIDDGHLSPNKETRRQSRYLGIIVGIDPNLIPNLHGNNICSVLILLCHIGLSQKMMCNNFSVVLQIDSLKYSYIIIMHFIYLQSW